MRPYYPGDVIDPRLVMPATFCNLRRIVDDKTFAAFYWPQDGEQYDEPSGKIVHGGDHDLEPLVVDMFTASAMLSVYDALNQTNQEKFEAWLCKSRSHFVKLVDITWGAYKK